MNLIQPIEHIIRHAHLFCGLGAGARGFNLAQPRIGSVRGRFQCVGGIDVDAGAIRNFTRLTGVEGTVLDLFDREQYVAFHGKEPPADWREAAPAAISNAFGPDVDVMFLSAPCKGFSGLLGAAQSKTDKYQALNRLTLRGIWLTLEAYKDDPIPIILFENVPRIQTRGRWLLDQIGALLRSYGYSVNEDTHDCGVIGGLAQSRKRFLLIARHATKIPPFIYQPEHRRLRGVGEVIGKLPLPGDPIAGAMHRVPSLQWKTWVRLAFVPAGKDWRALNDYRVENGNLADFGIVPDVPLRDNALGVVGWNETAPVLTSQRAPGQGRFSVADPRDPEARNNGYLGVKEWDDASGTVGGASKPGNGTYSVADPRPGYGAATHRHVLGVNEWDGNATGVISGDARPNTGMFSVADPRPPAEANQTYNQYGVNDWEESTGAVSAQSTAGGGAHSVADPRLNRTAHSNVYRVVAFDETAVAVTSSREGAIADPRPAGRDLDKSSKYQVVPMDGQSRTVIAASTTGEGAFAVADPRAFGGKHQRDGYQTGGHYGVIDWQQTALAVSGSANHDNGFNSVADPRDVTIEGTAPTLPAASDRLICRIVAMDNTWHRPFTTLDLAALQSLFDPEEAFGFDDGRWFARAGFDLEGGSDVTKREWIGNAVPGAAATGMAETIGEAIVLARLGESFMLSTRDIWVKPGALALAVDNDQHAFRLDAK